MSLQSRLSDLITAIGGDISAITTSVDTLYSQTVIDGGASPSEAYDTPAVVDYANKSILMLGMGAAQSSLDLNHATGMSPDWSEVDDSHPDWTFDSPNWIEANFTGKAWFSVNLEFEGFVARGNLRIRIEKQDTGAEFLRGGGAMGYVRNASGHDEASIYLRVYDPNVTPTSKYRVWSQQYAAAGTLNPVTSGCYFCADRVI